MGFPQALRNTPVYFMQYMACIVSHMFQPIRKCAAPKTAQPQQQQKEKGFVMHFILALNLSTLSLFLQLFGAAQNWICTTRKLNQVKSRTASKENNATQLHSLCNNVESLKCILNVSVHQTKPNKCVCVCVCVLWTMNENATGSMSYATHNSSDSLRPIRAYDSNASRLYRQE